MGARGVLDPPWLPSTKCDCVEAPEFQGYALEFSEENRRPFGNDSLRALERLRKAQVGGGAEPPNRARFFAPVPGHFSQVFTRKTSENLYRTATGTGSFHAASHLPNRPQPTALDRELAQTKSRADGARNGASARHELHGCKAALLESATRWISRYVPQASRGGSARTALQSHRQGAGLVPASGQSPLDLPARTGAETLRRNRSRKDSLSSFPREGEELHPEAAGETIWIERNLLLGCVTAKGTCPTSRRIPPRALSSAIIRCMRSSRRSLKRHPWSAIYPTRARSADSA